MNIIFRFLRHFSLILDKIIQCFEFYNFIKLNLMNFHNLLGYSTSYQSEVLTRSVFVMILHEYAVSVMIYTVFNGKLIKLDLILIFYINAKFESAFLILNI